MENSNREKGNSLFRIVDDYVLVDIETTGLSPQRDDIIEIGAIKVKENEIIDTYSSLIYTNRRLPYFITKLTGITNDMLEEGREIDKVLIDFLNFVGDDIIIGHNVNFDISFLHDKCNKYLNRNLSNDFIDTMRLARKLVPESPNYKLGTLAKVFNIDYSNAHRGLKDVEITYEVYNKLREIC